MTKKTAAAKKIANVNVPLPNAALAAYACDPVRSRGRLLPEPKPSHRSEFQRDRDRIVHSGAFRKLEYKTQVFVNHEGDYYRTRLTHSLEVAQITRAIARALRLNEDLAETCALAHDLGHTPFGHAGEDALNEVMDVFGGFNHNDQTLRILTQLETRYAKFDGLNLSWETLEGVVKHNGPLPKKNIPPSIAAYNRQHNLELFTFASAEAQVAALADDIAYNNHDIDDGLRAGLFTIDDLASVPLCAKALQSLRQQYPDLDQGRLIAELIRDLIGQMVGDVLAETGRRIAHLKPQSADDIRLHNQPVVAFSNPMQSALKDLKEFLMQRMYRHHRVNRMTSKARRVVRELFMILLAEPECLPAEWQQKMLGLDEKPRARIIADYIAGMTDRYALDEHRRLFDVYARS